MKAPKTIPRSAPPDICSNYQALLRKGVQYCQELGGDVWTDYNEHDPGVTILEQLCYALTDIGYRADYPIEDLICNYKGKIDSGTNSFFTPAEIFTVSPVIISDYRKLLIDNFDNVKNAWLTTEVSTGSY